MTRTPALELWDLHAHTTASDGVYSPTTLIEQAQAAGLTGIAVSDHDSLAGVPEAKAAGERLGVQVIAGIELSSTWERPAGEPRAGTQADVHLLGLFLCGLDPDAQRLLQGRLLSRRTERLSRGREIVDRLRAAGVNVTWEEVHTLADGGAVGRPHVARVLIQGGYVTSIEEAFDRYLSPGRVGYVAQPPLPTPEAVDWVHAAGGAAIWAHPGLSGLRPEAAPWLDSLDALEVDYPRHDAATRQALQALATAHGLLTTGSSDCHGTPGREQVGVCTTSGAVLQELARRTGPGA